MAVIQTIADDFDGSTPAETMTFHVNGKGFQIDLSEEHASELQDILDAHEEALRKYTSVARPLGRAASAATTSAASSQDLAKIRAWAKKNGHEVADRGRISKDVLEAYASRGKK